MRIRWRKRAIDDLTQIRTWLSTIENAKPGRTILRIREAVKRLERLPFKGPPIEDGQRKLSVPNAPYIVIYSVRRGVIDILAVFHMARDR